MPAPGVVLRGTRQAVQQAARSLGGLGRHGRCCFHGAAVRPQLGGAELWWLVPTAILLFGLNDGRRARPCQVCVEGKGEYEANKGL
jgi:hypothetical protein